MSQITYFELRRQIDDTVYKFTRMQRPDGSHAYKRSDRDLWIVYDQRLGWFAPHPDTGEVSGRPWYLLPDEQSDHPPAGDWVNKKGAKSYVYTLVYPL